MAKPSFQQPLLHIFVETFFFLWLESSKEQHLFETELSKIVSLLIINLFKNWLNLIENLNWFHKVMKLKQEI